MKLTEPEEKLVQYAHEHQEVSVLYLFGSAAQGTMTPLSDFDVAVRPGDALPERACGGGIVRVRGAARRC
ncbi:MAG: nucleotidyltransferase domain-containing protein [Candidatus Bipolaricaulota bacterium]|nr:nucleotidyltransferase domain-containing protein [Candidatus Bipolaricaulota bacterium]